MVTVLRHFKNGSISDGCGDADDDNRHFDDIDDYDYDDYDDKLKNCRQ
jgi:hypothetical protein